MHVTPSGQVVLQQECLCRLISGINIAIVACFGLVETSSGQRLWGSATSHLLLPSHCVGVSCKQYHAQIYQASASAVLQTLTLTLPRCLCLWCMWGLFVLRFLHPACTC
jgi:hypothetical protein